MDYSWFQFWVVSLWGNELLALIGTAAFYSFIGIFGRMSWFILASLLIIYFVAFGAGFYGAIFVLVCLILSMIYFFINLNKWITGE